MAQISIYDGALRALFDIAVSSMDFGSGFLDDEEVSHLRAVAVILGVDPMRGTPDNFKCKYRGHHEAEPYLDPSMFISFADELWRNAYVGPDRAPGGQQVGRGLAKIGGIRIGMWCLTCGRRWEAFEDTRLQLAPSPS